MDEAYELKTRRTFNFIGLHHSIFIFLYLAMVVRKRMNFANEKTFVFYLPAADIFTRKILKNEYRAFAKCDVNRLPKYCIIVM